MNKKQKIQQVRLSDIIENVMAYVCYGCDKDGKQYIQCKNELLKVADYEYFQSLGAEAKRLNEYRIRFWFPDNVKIVED